VHHVELLLDEASDTAVREQWRRLDEAGLPSQARHRSASNRPHVTLTVTEAWPGAGELDSALAPLAALPVHAVLGAPTVFGCGRFVLARAVVATEALLALQGALVERLGPPASDLLLAGRWVPHVTLGRRLSSSQVGEALELLGGHEGPGVVFGSARHWDSVARTDQALLHHPAPAADA
jgi:2'-5' RNA ligase